MVVGGHGRRVLIARPGYDTGERVVVEKAQNGQNPSKRSHSAPGGQM